MSPTEYFISLTDDANSESVGFDIIAAFGNAIISFSFLDSTDAAKAHGPIRRSNDRYQACQSNQAMTRFEHHARFGAVLHGAACRCGLIGWAHDVSKYFIAIVLLSFSVAPGDAKTRLAQTSTQTLFACLNNCEAQTSVCRSSCTINSAANAGNTSPTAAGQVNQCFIDCTRVLLVCKQACASAGLQ